MSLKKISIILFIAMLFVEFFAFLAFLLPVSGLFYYPFIAGFAMMLGILSAILARHSKVFRILAMILAVAVFITIVYDVVFLIRVLTGMI